MTRIWRDFDPRRSPLAYRRVTGKTDNKGRRKTVIAAIESCQKRASKIAIEFSAGKESAGSHPHVIGGLRTKRIAVPPFRRPEALLKRQVYALALDIHRIEIVNEIEWTVRDRDEPFRHKPRNPTFVDWAIKLVDRAPRAKKTAIGSKEDDPLFEPTFAGHLATELNFAFKHGIKPAYVGMFIDQVGGYEIISAMERAGGYNLESEGWISAMCDESLKSEASDVEGHDDEDVDEAGW